MQDLKDLISSDANNDITKIVNHTVEKYLESFFDFLPKLVFTLVLLFILWKITNVIVKIVRNILQKRELDHSVNQFICRLVNISLKIIICISVATILGFEVTSLIAMIGAAGLAIGLALQGALQNFAGGVIILILKPFKTGDDVEFGGQRGAVKEVQLFSTVIEKFVTNEVVIVPNSAISSNTLTNWSRERDRRIDIPFGVAYGSNVEQIREILTKAADNYKLRLPEHKSEVSTTALGSSSVDMLLKVWVNPANYFEAHSDLVEMVYNELNKNNIEIPFPQVVVTKKN